MDQGGTLFTILVTLATLLWYISTKFNQLEIEQHHLKESMVMIQTQISKINEHLKSIPLNSQMILAERGNIQSLNKDVAFLNLRWNKMNANLNFYVVKNDFRMTASKVYVNSRAINYIRGQLHDKLHFSE